MLARIASANGMRLTSVLPARSKPLARSWIQEVTSESAGPPCGGLYLKPPSRRRVVRGRDHDAVAILVGAAASCRRRIACEMTGVGVTPSSR